MTEAEPAERRVLSPRLEEFLEEVRAGQTPNFGTFCSSCYNPVPADRERCDHCGQDLLHRPPVPSIPSAVIEMFQRKQRRESLIVNAFAFLGLFLGLALFLGLIAIDVFYLDRTLWLLIVSLVVLLVSSRLFAGLLGGVIGDEVGYRYANDRLAEEWAAHVHEREAEATGRD